MASRQRGKCLPLLNATMLTATRFIDFPRLTESRPRALHHTPRAAGRRVHVAVAMRGLVRLRCPRRRENDSCCGATEYPWDLVFEQHRRSADRDGSAAGPQRLRFPGQIAHLL